MKRNARTSVFYATLLLGNCAWSNVSMAQGLLSDESQKQFNRILSPHASGVQLSATDPLSMRSSRDGFERLINWNRVALEVTAADHSRGPLDGYDQLGPHRASRAMAIFHIAMYDAVNAITKQYGSYSGIADDAGQTPACVDAAISQAALTTLKALFPKETNRIDFANASDQASVAPTCSLAGADMAAGRAIGKKAADEILRMRSTDNTPAFEKDFGSAQQAMDNSAKFVHFDPGPGIWQPAPQPRPVMDDPSTPNVNESTQPELSVALGYEWGKVTPFVLTEAAFNDAKPPPFPSLAGDDYAAQYDEVKRLGSETSVYRSADEEVAGVFWAYDGTPELCAPPRFYNQLAMQVFEQNIVRRPELSEYNTVSGLARYLALINTAMADAGIAAWEAKWRERVWRPVTAIRYASNDEGNDATTPDAGWIPYGAPATNGQANFTPPFPAYPSGHAAFGGALFEVLRHVWGENTSFGLVSDEFNGLNSPAGSLLKRDFVGKTFLRLSEAEWQNARSRIWLGIHWNVDAVEGVKQGNKIGKFVYENKFKPR